MLTKIKKTMSNMSTKDWIAFSLWLLTFVLLIVFVILAAALTKGTEAYSNTLASVGTTFALSLIAAMFTTVAFAWQKKEQKEGKK